MRPIDEGRTPALLICFLSTIVGEMRYTKITKSATELHDNTIPTTTRQNTALKIHSVLHRKDHRHTSHLSKSANEPSETP